MNKFLLIVISALLTACGALLGMQLYRLGTVSNDVVHIKATTTAICQAMADMGHPIVNVAEEKNLEKKSFVAGAPAPGPMPAKAKAAK